VRQLRVELCLHPLFVRLEIAQTTVHRCDSADAGRCERRVYTAAKIRGSDPRCAAAPCRRATIASQHRTAGIGYPASSDRSAMSHRATARHSRRTNSRSRAIQSARRRPARAQAARRANRPSLDGTPASGRIAGESVDRAERWQYGHYLGVAGNTTVIAFDTALPVQYETNSERLGLRPVSFARIVLRCPPTSNAPARSAP
jgi:hypothetical protein